MTKPHPRVEHKFWQPQQEPSKHWDAPVLQGKARQSSGELHPSHLTALQHLQKSAAIQASRGLSPAADLSHQGLEAFLTLLHHPWKRFPCTHRSPGSILPAPPCSLQPLDLGTGPGWVERLQ